MIGQFVDTMILASKSIEWSTHQTLSLEKYWKLFSATLSQDSNLSIAYLVAEMWVW